MDKKGEHVIFFVKSCHIILELPGIHFASSAAQHFNYCLFQPVKVHVNIDFQGLISFRTGPVALKLLPNQCIRNGFRVVYMQAAHTISIVPCFHFCIIYIIMPALLLHFLFCKSKVFPQTFRVGHGIFIKNIEGRMFTVFFYGEDSRHVSQLHIFGPLKKPPQKVQIVFLYVFLIFGHPKHTVPFIDYEDKSCFCLVKYLIQSVFEPVICCFDICRKFFQQLCIYSSFNLGSKSLQILFGFQKTLYIQPDYMVAV